MSEVVGINPYDLSNLLKGPCRVLYAPTSVAIPTSIAKIIEPEKEYKPKTGWLDFGATTQGSAYSRQFSTAGYTIEQTTGNVDEDVTDAVRSVQASFAELTPEFLQIMENAAEVETVAKAEGQSAEKQVKFGTVQTLEAYRIALIAQRPKGLGADVTEKDEVVRGAFAALVLYRAKITGDQTAIQLARGQLGSAQLTFQGYPESGQSQGEEHGLWIVEQSGTIE